MDSTYTYVRYFSEEAVEPLWRQLDALAENFLKRSPHMSEKGRIACQRRLELVRSAARLLDEPVPKPFE
ncbi:MAG: hypothetical protein ACYDDZ_11070 [Acidimicrobiales bacterium]